MTENSQMLDFVKALANADRLKIVGMLVQNPARLPEIAAGLIPAHAGGIQSPGISGTCRCGTCFR